MGADEFGAAQASTDPWVWTRAWAAKEAAYKCLSALVADLAFDALVPCWPSPDRGELHASVAGATVRVELNCRIRDDLMWVVAAIAWRGE